MKTQLINDKGNWNFPWTETLMKEVQCTKNNSVVGEKLLLETESFKVWSINLSVGRSLPFHRHNKPYFYIAINKGKSRSFYADGKVVETEYEKNDIKNIDLINDENYFAHNLENIGETTLIFTTVEFKKMKQ